MVLPKVVYTKIKTKVKAKTSARHHFPINFTEDAN